MFAAVFIGVMVVGIVAFDVGRRWWLQNQWRRHWRKQESSEDEH